MQDVARVLDYWFGNEPDDGRLADQRAPLWWSKNADTDAEIRDRFEPLVLAAERGELADWEATPEGRLALIILTDQFPRNIYRDTPDAFRFDGLARQHCLEGIRLGQDRGLRPVQRVFWYMPLEHSEVLEHQDQSVALFRELAEEVDAALASTFEYFLDFAIRHRDIIQRFGRFPHRNTIVGRASTEEEQAFLQQPGSSF
ncbi:Uncharacterized conserved protein, DUF924 family [Aquisalimonas asiatica]|uniref:Uncharacterized conserved protein, DUF924 family n=2 Tax=Aquisalimonas asiatica TaxID=406100 RepID=A0A1H8Q1V0_9GAMM|nr:Uncharacterized conserved protein, DUF924 family [Aquisalimonas asiatica]